MAAVEVPAANRRTVVIRPTRGIGLRSLGELWRYRELLYFLVWRDVKIRYKQTAIGAGWALVQPLLTMIVFSIIFGGVAKIPSDGLPYPIFSFVGVLGWTYFSTAAGTGSSSVVRSGAMISKVYFPRLFVPLGAVVVPYFDLAFSAVVLAGLFIWYGIAPAPQALLAIPLLGVAGLIALGVALWLSAVNVRFRDVQYAVPFLLQIWMFASPVIYPTSFVPADWQWLLALNPMTAVLTGLRWALLGTAGPSTLDLVLGSVVTAALLLTGLAYFQRTQRGFADNM